MSFTTVNIVKKHLVENRIAANDIEAEPVKLLAGVKAKLKYPPVSEDSEKVKAREQIKPDYQVVTFTAEDKVNLNKTDLIPDSVVVASDSSLGLIYKENIDYSIDYDNGTLTRITSGGIAELATVSVWYLPYRLYQRGTDYSIDYARGEIQRLISGEIEAGQYVYVDYVSEYAIVEDNIIENAINEANEQILNYIDSLYAGSADRSLVIAETYLAVSIICRIKAVRAMSLTNKNAEAVSWQSLTDQYKREAFLMLEKFTGSLGGLRAPHKA